MTDHRQHDLADARDALEYWERRGQALPRRDRRGRREALEMTDKARARVTEAERTAFGQGALGALNQLASEGRLPQPVRDTSRRVARRGRQAAVLAVAVTVALSVLLLVAAILVVLALLGML